MSTRSTLRLVFATAVLLSVTGSTLGCFFGCGAAGVPTDDNGTAYVTDGGTVVFDPAQVGTSVTFSIPIHDTADVDETLLGASFSGPNAADFQVVDAQFPIAMPAGQQVSLVVQFTPSQVGPESAVLDVQTKDMGVSPISISGAGVGPDGGTSYGCGASPVPSNDNGTASITDGGSVVFDATQVGAAVTFTIPVHDTADAGETLLGATFSGPNADEFQVVDTVFPIAMPAGAEVSLTVQFWPTTAGSAIATLDVQTKDMGVSPIQLRGNAVAADGG